MQSEGLIRSYIDDNGQLRWTMTPLGKTFQALVTDHAGEPVISSRFDVGRDAVVEDVVSPEASDKLLVDIGPANDEAAMAGNSYPYPFDTPQSGAIVTLKARHGLHEALEQGSDGWIFRDLNTDGLKRDP